MPKITIREWLKKRSPETAHLLKIFDDENEELCCACIAEEFIVNGPLTINLKLYKIIYNGKELRISKKIFQIIEYFARNKNRVISTKELNSIFFYSDDDSQSLRVFIGKIRKLFDDKTVILTIPWIGYKMKEFN